MQEALSHYLDGGTIGPLGSGLINETFLVEHGEERFVLQRVNKIFDPLIHDNIVAVTEHLEACGMATPRLVRSKQGDSYITLEDGVWRLMTHVEGVSIDVVDSPGQARSAGQLVGRFHSALDSLKHEFVGMRLGVHDTPKHLETLATALDTHRSHRLFEQVAPLAEAVCASADRLDPIDPKERACHGDLKLNNVMFANNKAQCLIDLDTVGPMPLAYEIGDALRSWCNRSGEDAARANFDLPVYREALAGYQLGLGRKLTDTEKNDCLVGVEWATMELAARFAADALNESYFGYDGTRFPAAGEHNLVRSRSQWSLHQAVTECRAERRVLL